MKLWCCKCNMLHKFTQGEVERIVYALAADTSENFGPHVKRSTVCLQKVLWEYAGDTELYFEFVEMLVERRRQNDIQK